MNKLQKNDVESGPQKPMKSLTNVTLETKENRKYHNPKTNVFLFPSRHTLSYTTCLYHV